jgi:hypothetical protein
MASSNGKRRGKCVAKGSEVADDRVMEDAMLRRFVLVPLVPLGTRSVLGPVSQDQVIAAVRLAAERRFGAGLQLAVRGLGGPGPSWGRARFRAPGQTRVLRRPVFQDQRVRRRRGAGDWGRRLY